MIMIIIANTLDPQNNTRASEGAAACSRAAGMRIEQTGGYRMRKCQSCVNRIHSGWLIAEQEFSWLTVVLD